MAKRTFWTLSLPALGLAAWLLAPGWAVAQHHGGGHSGGHAGGFSGHAGAGAYHGGTGYHYSDRGGYSGRGYYGGYWGGHRGYGGYGWGPFIGLGLGLGYSPWYSGYYPWGSGYSYYGSYAPYYYGSYEPAYSDYGYPDSYQPYYGSTAPAVTAPSYGSSYGYYQPPASVLPDDAVTTPNAAEIRVRVPADAQVWFEGQPTKQQGTMRDFESPPLTSGKEYAYEIRAQWKDGDREVTQTRHIDVHAGDRLTVDFTKGSSTAGQTGTPSSSSPPPRPVGS